MNINSNMTMLKEMFRQKRSEGKSQNEAAEFLGIDHRSVSRHMSSPDLSIQTLLKYAEYLECDLTELVNEPVTRQINGYVKNNQIHMYSADEERPTLTIKSALRSWWRDKKTIIIINKNDVNGLYYNDISLFSPWKSPHSIKQKDRGLWQTKEGYQNGLIQNYSKEIDQFLTTPFMPTTSSWSAVKVLRFAKWYADFGAETFTD
jgi:transcriptional regulator with XRE-family HTH domain